MIWNNFQDATFCASTLSGGNLKMLQTLQKNNCPWDKYAYVYTAKFGYIKIMKFALLQNCPRDSLICARASETNLPMDPRRLPGWPLGNLLSTETMTKQICPNRHWNPLRTLELHSTRTPS